MNFFGGKLSKTGFAFVFEFSITICTFGSCSFKVFRLTSMLDRGKFSDFEFGGRIGILPFVDFSLTSIVALYSLFGTNFQASQNHVYEVSSLKFWKILVSKMTPPLVCMSNLPNKIQHNDWNLIIAIISYV